MFNEFQLISNIKQILPSIKSITTKILYTLIMSITVIYAVSAFWGVNGYQLFINLLIYLLVVGRYRR